MDADGLVSRRRAPTNRRIQQVALTEAGEAAFQRMRQAAVAFDPAATRRFQHRARPRHRRGDPRPTTPATSPTTLPVIEAAMLGRWTSTWRSIAPTGTSAPDPFGLSGLRTGAVHRGPDVHLNVVRFDLPRLGCRGRSDWRSPPMPHRDRHDLVGSAGREHTGLDFSHESLNQARRRQSSRHFCVSPRPTSTARSPCSNAGHSTLCTPGSGLSAGSLTSRAGRRSWRDCCVQAAGCSSATCTQCSATLVARDGVIAVEDPYFDVPSRWSSDERGTYVETDHVFTATVTHQWSHGLGETITALLDAGMQLTGLAGA